LQLDEKKRHGQTPRKAGLGSKGKRSAGETRFFIKKGKDFSAAKIQSALEKT